MIKGQEEILKEEISTKIEEAGMIQEAGSSIGDIVTLIREAHILVNCIIALDESILRML